MKKILLCCGAGIATSTVVNRKLCDELDRRGYKDQYTVSICMASEVPSKSVNYDLCVSTVVISSKCECPLIIATGILMNRGTESIYNEICEKLGFN